MTRLEAIKKSIEKWEYIVKGIGVDKGSENCPLCAFYNADEGCGKCPINEKTENKGCRKTPYEEWLSHHNREHSFSLYESEDDYFRSNDSVYRVKCSECKKIAQKEVDFLKALYYDETEKEEKQEEKFKVGDIVKIPDCYDGMAGKIIQVDSSLTELPYKVKFQIGSGWWSEEALELLYREGK